MRRRRTAVLVVASLMLTLLTSASAPAEGALARSLLTNAAGNGRLATLIPANPVPGWTPVTQDILDRSVALLQQIESAAVKITPLFTGMSAVAASNAWRSSHGQLLQIELVAFVGKRVNAAFTRALRDNSAKVGAETVCEGATALPPMTLRSLASPAGYLSVCRAKSGGSVAKGIAFAKANVLGFVASTTTEAQLLAVSRRQYEMIPAVGFEQSVQPSSGHIGTTEAVSTTGRTYAVTLDALIIPARPLTPTSSRPTSGERYVAARLTIRDTGSVNVAGDADLSATAIGSNDQIYTSTFASVAGCTNFDYGSFQLSRSQSVVGCVTFEIPDAIRVSTIKWSTSAGGAAWSV